MDARERLEATINGEQADRIPVALWRHWPGDDQRSADLAHSIIEFQNLYAWDYIQVMPSYFYTVLDFGIYERWAGHPYGYTEITRPLVKKSLDWTEFRPLDPSRGNLAKVMEVLKIIKQAHPATPILLTIYSPLTIAAQLAGEETALAHLRTREDRFRTGLNNITETILRFIEALRQRAEIDGIVYVKNLANYAYLSTEEHEAFGLPYDLKILSTLSKKWWLNIIQIKGKRPILKQIAQYPVQAVCWEDLYAEPTLDEARTLMPQLICGGLSTWEHLHQGTPSLIRDLVRDAFNKTGGRRFILSAEQGMALSTPLSNIRAARAVVEGLR